MNASSEEMARAEASPETRPKWPPTPAWRHVRAWLITLGLLLGLVDGCPIPTPHVMERLPPSLQAACVLLYDAQRGALTPFRPIKDALIISQRWALFSTTGGLRYRMWIEASAGPDEPWTLLYRAEDDAHAFRADTLECRRVRNTWNPSRRSSKRSYPAFASWMARTIFLADARYRLVRVSMERGQILERGKAFVPSGEFDNVMLRRREDVLP